MADSHAKQNDMNRAITLQRMLYSEVPKLKTFGDQREVGWYVHFLA